MFTGIITDLGAVKAIESPGTAAGGAGGDSRFVFVTGYDTAGITEGASIACSGVCLTLVDKGPGWFAADVSGETLSRSTLGDWAPGTPVNFERAMKLGDELGGHIVSGHVDGIAVVTGRRAEQGSIRFTFEAPAELAKFIASKGSVALDGVSLTVNEVDGRRFGVNIIPHTAEATTLGGKQPGDRVNLEIDMLARYVQRLLAAS
ncbi:riboflavin synthase [Pelagibius marinus]|uniref:riboflavin synthase n=1 Tax=Pelagibius marinus TaxID=2762760 RepID=UPI001872A05F|nr:riboflavin synthase [Pelagibius marinus]